MVSYRAKHWTFEVRGRDGTRNAVEVPAHRLSDSHVRDLVQELVLREERLTLEEYVSTHLNHRAGGPLALAVGELTYEIHSDAHYHGYYVFGLESYAAAWAPLSDEAVKTHLQLQGR